MTDDERRMTDNGSAVCFVPFVYLFFIIFFHYAHHK